MKTYSFYFRHLDKDGCVFNHFLDLVTLEDGKADSVVAAIKTVLEKKELPVDRLYGLGTDGAAVMTGMEFIVKYNGLCDIFIVSSLLLKQTTLHFILKPRPSEWSGKAAHRQLPKAGFCSVCCSQTSTRMQRLLKCCKIYGKLPQPPAGTAPIF